MENKKWDIWYEVVNELFQRCGGAVAPTDDEVADAVRQLQRSLMQAPKCVKTYFNALSAEEFEALLAQGAFESMLLRGTQRVGMMFSRSPSGLAVATVSITDPTIERSCYCDQSLAMAMTGAVAAFSMAVVELERHTPLSINEPD